MRSDHAYTSDAAKILAGYGSAPIDSFDAIVNSYLTEAEFQIKAVHLIEKYPLFLPPYLEILELLEKVSQTEDYRDFLQLTKTRLWPLLSSTDAIPVIAQTYGFKELLLVKFLLERLRKLSGYNIITRLFFARTQQLIESTLQEKTPQQVGKNIECSDPSVDVADMQRILAKKEHHWFARSERQTSNISHLHTQAILLRNNKQVSVDPIPADGPHESTRSSQAVHFKIFIDFVEQFAEEHQLGLGRVALVRLRPGKLVYRHCDTEINLRTRTRFHLVIEAKEGNTLILGNELAHIKEGQLWRYENKVMHKSYNESDTWRTNLIFDTFPRVVRN